MRNQSTPPRMALLAILSFLLVAPLMTQAQFGEPECIGVCKPTMDVRVHTITPTFGSVAGGTLLTITGVGFSEDRFNGNNQVDLAGVNCPVISFYSTPTRLVCRTPPRPQGLPDNRAVVRVVVDNKRIGLCASCSFEYSERRTPILLGVQPPVGAAGTPIRLLGRVFGSLYTDYSPFLVGSAVCAVDDEDNDVVLSLTTGFRSEDGGSRTSGWTRASDNGAPQCKAPPQEAGLYPVRLNVLGDKGDALVMHRSATRFYREDRAYNFLQVPVISSVQPSRVSPFGLATLTIQGTGFSQTQDKNVLKVGSATCSPKSQVLSALSSTQVVCELEPSDATSGTLISGLRGALLDYEDGSEVEVLDSFEATTESKPSVIHSFFYALDDGDTETSTADHTFVVKAQGAVTLKISSGISTDAGDLTTILELTNPTAEMGTDFFADDSQKSQVVTLQKNSPYYIKMEYVPSGANSKVAVGVILASSVQRPNSMSERQQISIESDVVREVHRITLPNTFESQFRIFYAGPVGDEEKNAVTGPLSISSSASQVATQLRRGDTYNALNELVEYGFRLGSIEVFKTVESNFTHFDIRYNSPSMPGVRRLPVLTRLANGPLLNLDSQYLTGVVQVPPSLPVSGTFSVDVDGSSLLDLPFDISNEDLWILLEEQPSVSQVSVTRSGNCLDGCTWFVDFVGSPGEVGFLLQVSDSNNLAGTNVTASTRKTFSGSLDRFTPNLPGDFLEQPVDAPRALFVSSNGVVARCSGECGVQVDPAVAPVVDSVVEDSVTPAGVATLTITGDFDPQGLFSDEDRPLTVLVGSSPCVPLEGNPPSKTTLQCETTPGVAGEHPVRVILGGVGSSDPSAATYSFSLVLASVQPDSGSVYGGTTLVISGNGFSSTVEDNEVTVGGIACQVVSATASELVCTTGSAEGVESLDQDIIVTVLTDNTDTLAASFSYLSNKAARILSVSPSSSGGAGVTTTLSILGTDLVRGAPADHTVSIGSVPCTVLSVDEDPDNAAQDLLICSMTGGPHGVQVVRLVRLNDGYALSQLDDGSEDPVTFTFSLEITAATNLEGSVAGGVLITLTGSSFDESLAKNSVTVGEEDCPVISASATEVVCRAPALAAEGSPYAITLSSNQFLATCNAAGDGCVYTSSVAKTPTVTSLQSEEDNSPLEEVLFGQVVVVGGTGFGTATEDVSVVVGGAPCDVTSVEDTSIICTVQGATAADGVAIQVDRLGWGWADNSQAPTVSYPLRVTSVSHQVGSLAGGHVITLSGQGFSNDQEQKPNTVTFSGQDLGTCTIVTATSTEEIVCRTPASSVEQNATLSVQVQTSFESLTAPVTPNIIHKLSLDPMVFWYEYQQASTPTVSSSSQSGNDLTIQGTHFSTDPADMTVTIHGVDCPVSVSSATSCTCSLGQVPAGVYQVVVVNSQVGRAAGSLQHTTSLVVGAISAASLTGSRAGGSTITVAGSGFSSFEGETTVTVCNAPCGLSSVTYNELECETGPLYLSLEEVPDPPITLKGTPFGSAANPQRAFDLDYSSNYVGAQGGHVGLDLGVNSVARVTRIRIFPREDNGATGRARLEGAVVEGSVDNASWTTLASLQGVVPGWNTIVRDLPAANFRFLRLRSEASTPIEVAEVLFQGKVISTLASGVCDVHVSVNGITPISASNQFTYSDADTPAVTSVSPDQGSAAGGTAVTLTGSGFPDGVVEDVSVTFNGQSCTVNSVSETEIQCVTSELPLGVAGARTSIIVVNVAGKGKALVSPSAIFMYRDLWSATRTWEGGELPVAGDTVVIPKGRTIVLDVSPPLLQLLIVEGALIFDHQDLHLQSRYIVVKDGLLQVGTEAAPFQHSARITLHGKRNALELPTYGAKNIMVHNGVLDLHGKDYGPTWTMLDGHATNGTTSITVEDATQWEVGQSIVIAPTGFEFDEYDEAVITAVSNGGRTFELDRPLRHSHWGTIQTIEGEASNGGQQYTIDTRAEVGLLSRNVVVEGDEESHIGQYGVHIMLSGHGGGSTIGRFSNMELRQAGQAFVLGRYPIHYHMLGDVSDSYVRGCSIHHTFNRGVALHGVHYLSVEDNVAFHTMGHTYFVEDAIETHNQLVHNLAVYTQPSFSMLNTDTSPASFWITNPLNMLRNNAAAGSFNYGFWFRAPAHPEGPSSTTTVCPRGMQLGQFDDNRSHSNGRYGLRVFEFLNPRQHPCMGGSAEENPWIPTEFRRLTTFKNKRDGATVNSVGDVRLLDFRVADNKHFGIQVALINAPTNPGPRVQGGFVVGYSQDGYLNAPGTIGLRTPRTENFLVDGVSFVNFGEHGAALAACTKCEPSWPTKNQGGYTHVFQNLLFEHSPRRIKWNMPRKAIFQDLDGSLRASKGSEPGYVMPYWAHNAISTCTYDAHTQQVFDDGLSCSPSVPFRRVAVWSIQPSFALNWKNMLVSVEGRQSSVGFLDKTNPNMGWVTTVPLTKTVNINWDNFVDFTFVRLGFNLMQPADRFQMDFDYVDVRDHFVVQAGGSPAPEATSAAELSAANAPNGLFFQDKDLERVSVVASGSGPGVGGLTVEGFRCPVGGCPQPLPVVGNITVAHWSDPRTWEERYCEDSDLGIVKKCTDSDAPAGCACAKPVAGESVYIPEGLHLYLDESTPLLESLLVDGHLEFDENVPGLKELNAKRIMIRRSEDGASATCVLNPQDNKEYCRNFLGAITAGTPESRFGSNATVVPAPVARIRLHGDFDDEPLRLASEYDLGPKVLANFGKLALHGSHRPIVWAKLAETATAESSSILVEGVVNWRAGDKLVLTPSSDDFREWEVVTVAAAASVEGGRSRLQLTDPLQRTYWGELTLVDCDPADVAPTPQTCTVVDGRIEVGLLSHNVEIVSQPDTKGMDFGCHVYTGRFVRPDVSYHGFTQLDNVHVHGCGQKEGTRSALFFQNLGNNPHPDRLSYVRGSSFVSSFLAALEIQGSSGINVHHNVFFGSFRSTVRVYAVNNIFSQNLALFTQARPSTAAKQVDILATYEIFGANDFVGNVAGGCEGTNTEPGHGYLGFSDACEVSPNSLRVRDNVVHSSHMGFLIHYEWAQACTQINRVTAFKNRHIGVFALRKSNFVLRDAKLLDNAIGAAFLHGNIGASNRFDYQRVVVVGARNSGSCTARVGILSSAFALDVKSMPPKASELPWENVKTDPPVYGVTHLRDITFARFGDNGGSCANPSHALENNQLSPDAAHPMVFRGVRWAEDTEWEFRFFSHFPNPSWRNPTDCGDMDCDGPKHVFWKDMDGSLTGLGSNATVVAHTPGIADPALCSLRWQWNAYLCRAFDLQTFVIESRDADRYDRRVAPVALRTKNRDGSTRTVYLNGPMDHLWNFDYTSQRRLSTFWSVVQVNKEYDVSMTGTNPKRMRMYFLNAPEEQSILITLNYTTPEIVQVRNEAGTLVQDAFPLVPTLRSPHASNTWQQPTRTLVLNVRGSRFLELNTIAAVFVNVRMQMSIADFFEGDFISNVVSILNIDPATIKIASVRSGSVIVEWFISEQPEDPNWTPEQREAMQLNSLADKLALHARSVGEILPGVPILDMYLIRPTNTSSTSTLETIVDSSTTGNSGTSSGGISMVVIIGSAVGGLAIIVAVVVSAVIIRNRRRRRLLQGKVHSMHSIVPINVLKAGGQGGDGSAGTLPHHSRNLSAFDGTLFSSPPGNLRGGGLDSNLSEFSFDNMRADSESSSGKYDSPRPLLPPPILGALNMEVEDRLQSYMEAEQCGSMMRASSQATGMTMGQLVAPDTIDRMGSIRRHADVSLGFGSSEPSDALPRKS